MVEDRSRFHQNGIRECWSHIFASEGNGIADGLVEMGVVVFVSLSTYRFDVWTYLLSHENRDAWCDFSYLYHSLGFSFL